MSDHRKREEGGGIPLIKRMAKQGGGGIAAVLEAVFPLWEDRRRGCQRRRKCNAIASSSLSLTGQDSRCSASPLCPQDEQVRVDTKDRCDVVTSHGLATSSAERSRAEGSGGGVEGGRKGGGGVGIGIGEWWWGSYGGEGLEKRRQDGGMYCQGERGAGGTKARGKVNDKWRWRWWLENGNRGVQTVRRGNPPASPGHNGCDVACVRNREEGVESVGAGGGRRVLWRAVTRALRQAVPDSVCSDAMVSEGSSPELLGSAMSKKGRKREDDPKDDHDCGWGRFGGSRNDTDHDSVVATKANVGIAAWRTAAWASIVVASNPAFSACVDVSGRDPDLGMTRPAEVDEDGLPLPSSSLSLMTRKGAGDGGGGGGGRSPRRSGEAGGETNNRLADGTISEGDAVHLRRRLRTQVVDGLEGSMQPYIGYGDGGGKEQEDMVAIRKTLPSCEEKLVLGITAGSSALGRRREGVEDEEVEEDEEGEDDTAEGRGPSSGLRMPWFAPDGPAQRRQSFSTSMSLSELVAGNRRTLPLWERNGRRWRQYVWDGRKLQTVDVDVNSKTETEREDEVGDEMDEERQQSKRAGSNALLLALQSRLRRARRGVQSVFVPEDVTPDYWEYMRWRITQRTISSFNHVNATQSLLRAVGVGSKKILPTAAAVNWVLKDGLGRLGKLAYVARFGRTLDSELKRVRFTTSLLFTLSLGMEMTTPFFPQLFLPIATLANVGKSIGLAAYVATTPSMNKSFALMENMADVAAKGQAQTVVADNVGLALAVGLNAAIKDDNLRRIMPLTLYPVLASLDLYAIWKELKSVHLRTLNRERMEIIVDKWLKSREVPSADRVSDREQLFCPSWNHFPDLPLTIGGLSKAVSSPSDLCNLLLSTDPLRSSRRYNLSMADVSGLAAVVNPLAWICHAGKRRVRAPRKQLVLSFRDDAEATDIIKGILHAGCLRSLLRPAYDQGGDGGGSANCALSSSPSSDSSPSAASVRQRVREESAHTRAAREGGWVQSRPARGSDKDNMHESGCDNLPGYSTSSSQEEKGGGDGRPGDWALSPGSRSIDQALEESRRMAEREFEPLMSAMAEKGWQTKIVTLASAERTTFSLVRGGHEKMVKKPRHHSPRVLRSVS
ncbi:hypothetical protein CBR_g42158 [Chara braunii]|uniref:Protein root UVB sensitive/RUS domain-containing protein n=1 Tax=Chara braunii TaxID=69332 RepID=A0A388LX24_CHABU|nr:hypothetical protein CBR_g42158 [Chara braunii]|eukprot:GBG86874.1 hypothetical protein CBR_g42158 [Chara braunii]